MDDLQPRFRDRADDDHIEERRLDRHSEEQANSPVRDRPSGNNGSSNDKGEPCSVLGFFGLSQFTTEDDLKAMCGVHGHVQSIELIRDKATGRSKCFGFVTMETTEGAIAAKTALSGTVVNSRTIRVDYSMTKKAHDPTPGYYHGIPTNKLRARDHPSASSSRRHSRSRSRSPRRSSGGGGRDRYRSRSPPRRRSPGRYDRDRERDHRDSRDSRRPRSRSPPRSYGRDRRDSGGSRRSRSRSPRRR